MNPALVDLVNAISARWMAWIVLVTVDAAALLAIVSLVWLTIRRKVAPQVGYWLLLLVPLKLLMPASLTVSPAIARWAPSSLVRAQFESPRESATAAPQQVTVDLPAKNIDEQLVAPSRFSETTKPAESSEPMSVVSAKALAAKPDRVVTPSSVALPAVTAAPGLTWPSLLMVLWLVGVMVQSARLVATQWRFRTRLKRLQPMHEGRLRLDLAALARQAGVRQTVRVVECADLAAPAVWGIFRPTILLPCAIATSLSRDQLRWVLLHELAHIRRRDLLVVVVQRLAAIVHFFNPAVWIANRAICRLREYACDDFAVAMSGSNELESSQTFVQILKVANRSSRALEGALGMFGFDAREACMQRVQRLLDAERPMRVRLGAGSLVVLTLVAVASLPHLRAADPPSGSPSDKTSSAAAKAEQAVPTETDAKAAETDRLDTEPANIEPADADHPFELTIMDSDGKPVRQALVEVRTTPLPVADQFGPGKFLRKASYGTFATADDEGRLTVKVAKPPRTFNVNITTPGYGPYWASWSSEQHKQTVPRRFTAQLEAGWTVAGIVVDEDGKPVKGAKVNPSIQYRKRGGDQSELFLGAKIETDAEGKWRFESVPDSLSEVSVAINHSDFKPGRRKLTRSEFEIEPGHEPAAKISLNRGLSIVGRVTDEAGNPIVGALVRTKFQNEVRKATTDETGAYKLVGCEPVTAKILVSAKGWATDMVQLRPDPKMEPVDFRMQPAGKLRVRVLDQEGNPVPKARIFFQRWRNDYAYFEFDNVNQYADAQGVWEWHGAPRDAFEADICPPDGMQLGRQTLVARDEEYVFRTPPALVISGKVIDAKTKEPIPSFRVVPGVRSSPQQMNWVRGDRFDATGGEYRLRHTHDYFAHLVRIEATGYLPAVSRDVKSGEGEVKIDFELERGQDVAVKVLTPAGAPAAGAKVALGKAGDQIIVTGGDIDSNGTYAARLETNAAGEFRFPPQESAYQLVITHPAGYAHVKATAPEKLSTIELEPWARIEGVFKVGKSPQPNVPITLNSFAIHSYGPDVPSVFMHYDVTTGQQGQFTFERVVAGNVRVGRRIMLTVNDGAAEATSSTQIALDLRGGETSRVTLGGIGRPVIGKLQAPEKFAGKVNWNFALLNVQLYFAPPPQEEDFLPEAVKPNAAGREAWLREWRETPAGRAWQKLKADYNATRPIREASPHYSASVALDGTFRIDDMPAGAYTASVWFSQGSAGRLTDYHFTIPPIEGERSDEALDLGTVTLE